MARTAKKVLSNSDPQAEENLTLPGVMVEAPVVKETHRVVRTWEQDRMLDDLEEEESGVYADDAGGNEEPQPEPDDPIAKLIKEIAGSRSNWALQVNRLPNYDRDQRTDPKSRRFVGTLSIPDPDYLKEEKYFEDLQAKYARGVNGNWFLLCVRRDNRNFAYLPTVCVEPPLPEVQAARAAENPSPASVNVYNPAPQGNGLADAIKQIKQLAELQAALMPPWMQNYNPMEHAQQPAAPVQQQSKAAQLIDLIADDEVVEGVTSKLKRALRGNGGSSEPERSWVDILYAAIENDTVPKLIQTFASMGAMQNGQAQMASSPPSQNQMASVHVAAPMDNGVLPQREQQGPQTQPQNEQPGVAPVHHPPPELILLNQVIHHCSLQAAPAASAAWINSFADQNPSVEPAIDMFLTMPPEQAQAFLLASFPDAAPVITATHARGWIAELQAALQPEDEPDGE